MFGSKTTLITAILMTTATLVWGYTLYATPKTDVVPTTNIIVVVLFAVLAVGYWVAYFRNKNKNTTGTE